MGEVLFSQLNLFVGNQSPAGSCRQATRTIDKDYCKDPLEKLEKKMEGRNLKFNLSPVTEKQVAKAMKKWLRKKRQKRWPEPEQTDHGVRSTSNTHHNND